MTWLDVPRVGAVLGADLMGAVDAVVLEEFCNAARAYVERKRADLFAVDDVTGLLVFSPTPDVVVGAALLAHRWYARRTSPQGVAGATSEGASGILRHDPDIARLLGIDAEGPFVFGAGSRVTGVL